MGFVYIDIFPGTKHDVSCYMSPYFLPSKCCESLCKLGVSTKYVYIHVYKYFYNLFMYITLKCMLYRLTFELVNMFVYTYVYKQIDMHVYIHICKDNCCE